MTLEKSKTQEKPPSYSSRQPLLVGSHAQNVFTSLFFPDLENFKTHRRSSVSVREGQGVVLLCGPPPHSGGKTFFFKKCLFHQRELAIFFFRKYLLFEVHRVLLIWS